MDQLLMMYQFWEVKGEDQFSEKIFRKKGVEYKKLIRDIRPSSNLLRKIGLGKRRI